MKCKACGNVIPSELLRQDSFSCPSCGKTYRRSSKSEASEAESRRAREAGERRERPLNAGSQAGASGLLIRVMACVTAIALVLSIIALVAGMRSKSFTASGQVQGIKVEGNKYITVPVEIPRQANENYMVALDINSSAVSVGIAEKTATSFTLGLSNRIKDARTVTVTWALAPCQVPAAKAKATAAAAK